MSYLVSYEQYKLLLSTNTDPLDPMKEIVQPPDDNLKRSQTERKNGQQKFEQSTRVSAGPAKFSLFKLPPQEYMFLYLLSANTETSLFRYTYRVRIAGKARSHLDEQRYFTDIYSVGLREHRRRGLSPNVFDGRSERGVTLAVLSVPRLLKYNNGTCELLSGPIC